MFSKLKFLLFFQLDTHRMPVGWMRFCTQFTVVGCTVPLEDGVLNEVWLSKFGKDGGRA